MKMLCLFTSKVQYTDKSIQKTGGKVDRQGHKQMTNMVKPYMYNLEQASYLSGIWSVCFCGIPTLTLGLENLGL